MTMTRRVRSIAGFGAGFAALVIAACLAWVMWPTLSDAEDQPTPIQSAVVQPAEETAAPNPAAAPATAAVPDAAQGPTTAAAPVASPLDGLKISSQSWRRGGLGARPLIPPTLRNPNDYAVKHTETPSPSARRDGSH